MRFLISLVMLFLPLGLALLHVDGWAIAGVGVAACLAAACLAARERRTSNIEFSTLNEEPFRRIPPKGGSSTAPPGRKCPSDDDPVILPMRPP